MGHDHSVSSVGGGRLDLGSIGGFVVADNLLGDTVEVEAVDDLIIFLDDSGRVADFDIGFMIVEGPASVSSLTFTARSDSIETVESGRFVPLEEPLSSSSLKPVRSIASIPILSSAARLTSSSTALVPSAEQALSSRILRSAA